jgi:hypothetical protein
MSDFTLTQLAALNAAIASGELSVQYDGKRVQYRSIDELIRARDLVRGDLQAAGLLAPPSARGRTTVAAFSRD